jgi:hypothetical protein
MNNKNESNPVIKAFWNFTAIALYWDGFPPGEGGAAHEPVSAKNVTARVGREASWTAPALWRFERHDDGKGPQEITAP